MKSTLEGVEKLLGNVSFERFVLGFALAKYDMKLDINLRLALSSLLQLENLTHSP